MDDKSVYEALKPIRDICNSQGSITTSRLAKIVDLTYSRLTALPLSDTNKDKEEHYKCQLYKVLDDAVPLRVKNWMREYRLPYEMFYCDLHDKWVHQLDTSFPFGCEQNKCEDC